MRQWILDKWHEYARKWLMLGIFLPPILFWRSTVDVFNLVKISALLLTTVLALVFWISYSAERKEETPRVMVMWGAIIFLIACLVATLTSSNVILSFTGLYHRYGGLLPFLLYFGVMMIIVGIYWERPEGLRDIAKASSYASAILLGYVLIQAVGLDWIQWRDASGGPPEFPVGTMGNSNFAGAYLGIALPFVVYMSRAVKRDFERAILYIIIALDVLALWFTQTRGGMIAAAVGVFVLAFLNRQVLARPLRVGVNLAAIAGVLIAVVVFLDIGSSRTSGPLAKLSVFRTGTLQIREYYWGTAWRIFKDNPIIGTGLETYYAKYPQYRSPEDGSKLGLTITDKPHNIFLEYASNSGILGLGSYLLFLGIAFFYGLKALRKLDGEKRFLLSTFLAVLAGYVGQGFFSIDVPPLAMMGWVAIGGIASISDPKAMEARERLAAATPKTKGGKKAARPKRIEPEGRTRWWLHLTGVVVASLLLLFGLRPLLADYRAKHAQTLRTQKSAPATLEAVYLTAISAFPLEPSYRVQLGAVSEQVANDADDPMIKEMEWGKALKRYSEAYAMQPGNVFYMMNIARVNAAWGTVDQSRFEKSNEWWQKAVKHDPTDWEVFQRYGLMLNDWANATGDLSHREDSAKVFEKAVAIRPDNLSNLINLAKIYVSLDKEDEALATLLKAIKIDPSNKEVQSMLDAL